MLHEVHNRSQGPVGHFLVTLVHLTVFGLKSGERIKRKYICDSGYPILPRLLTDPKPFIVKCDQNLVKDADK